MASLTETASRVSEFVALNGRRSNKPSRFSVAEAVTHRVKRWRDGDMRQRWCVAGLLDAESRFNRVKGYRHLARLIDALAEHANPTLDQRRKRA